jgi:hypothetical protein
MTEDQLRAAIQAAIEGVRNEARPLDLHLVHERSIAHRLAVHMEPRFRGEWDVDCEYDRDGQVKKMLQGIRDCDAERATDGILPDIIVHHRRGEGRPHNLLVIEIKKDAQEDPCDRRKLELLTDPGRHYQYQFGLYINVDGGAFTCTWYKDGRRAE